jgi:hypothetical protein
VKKTKSAEQKADFAHLINERQEAKSGLSHKGRRTAANTSYIENLSVWALAKKAEL